MAIPRVQYGGKVIPSCLLWYIWRECPSALFETYFTYKKRKEF